MTDPCMSLRTAKRSRLGCLGLAAWALPSRAPRWWSWVANRAGHLPQIANWQNGRTMVVSELMMMNEGMTKNKSFLSFGAILNDMQDSLRLANGPHCGPWVAR